MVSYEEIPFRGPGPLPPPPGEPVTVAARMGGEIVPITLPPTQPGVTGYRLYQGERLACVVELDHEDGPRVLDADGNRVDVAPEDVDVLRKALAGGFSPRGFSIGAVRMGNAVSGKTTAGLRDVIENELRGAVHVTEFGRELLKVLPEGAIPTRPFMDRPFMAPGPIMVDAAKREARLRHKDRQKAKKRTARIEQLAKRAQRKKGRRKGRRKGRA